MKLKIFWIKFKSIFNLPIYRKDALIWAKHYYANGDCAGLCYAIEDSISDLIHVHNKPQHFIPLLNPNVARSFQNKHGVDTSTTRYNSGCFWWRPRVWELNDGRLGFLNWLIEQYKDDKTDLRKL